MHWDPGNPLEHGLNAKIEAGSGLCRRAGFEDFEDDESTMFVTDASGFWAALVTKADHGCTEWKAKE